MAMLNWGMINGGGAFESLMHALVFAEDSTAVLFGRPGKDSGQDARSGDGLTVYQAEDFFPIKVILGEAVPFYLKRHSEQEIAFVDSDHIQILWCKQRDYPIDRFYATNDTASDRCFGIDGDATRWEAQIAKADWLLTSRDWHKLPPWLLSEVRSGSKKDFMMFVEAKYTGNSPMTLAIMSPRMLLPNSHMRDLCALQTSVSQVAKMYAVLNLRQEQPIYTAADSSPLPSSDTMVAFIHGYNVSEDDAEGWFNTVFKRLWQSGLNAHFCGITWNGDDQGILPDYYRNVFNAFQAAQRLDSALGEVPLASYTHKSIMAHSLGNMVVSAALQDYHLTIDNYFMLNAAVPAEAYDSTPVTYDFSTNNIPSGLIHDDWRNIDSKAWATFWHKHFLPQEAYTPTDADTARATLTWHGRFKDVLTNRGTTVYNYFSAGSTPNSGDEVFELMTTTPEPLDGFAWFEGKGRYSWQKQECYKGRHTSFWDFAFVASDIMGWGVESDVNIPTTSEAYRTQPYFYRNPESILQNDAASIHNSRDYLLTYGIPAMTQAVGRKLLGLNGQEYNLQDIYIDRIPNVLWARTGEAFKNRWLHSDVKDVAYPFVRAFYKNILEKGSLK